ncbi:hypothetical protein RFI_06922, partial [Reticulomyxa filosa]
SPEVNDNIKSVDQQEQKKEEVNVVEKSKDMDKTANTQVIPKQESDSTSLPLPTTAKEEVQMEQKEDQPIGRPKHKKSDHTLSFSGDTDFMTELLKTSEMENSQAAADIVEDAESKELDDVENVPNKNNELDSRDNQSKPANEELKHEKSGENDLAVVMTPSSVEVNEIKANVDSTTSDLVGTLASSTTAATTITTATTITITTTTTMPIITDIEISDKPKNNGAKGINENIDSEAETGEAIPSGSEDEEDGTDAEKVQLLESFLELKEPHVNWKMIEFFSKESFVFTKHILQSNQINIDVVLCLSNSRDHSYAIELCWKQRLDTIDYNSPIPLIKPFLFEDEFEIRATKLYLICALTPFVCVFVNLLTPQSK